LAEQGVTEELYAHVAEHDHPEYSGAEQVAIEYAEKFALDHLSLDDAFFDRLHEHFSDADILDLTICIADFMGFGRLTQVLQLDVSCEVNQ
jgi:alkylhydroperoxidase family enzyme